MAKTTQIYGIRAVIEAINAQEPIDKIFIQKGLRGELSKELEGLAHRNSLSVSYVPVERLNRITRNNHQGVIANISPIQFHNFETLVETTMETKEAPLFLLLDGVSDVRNFGAIIRTAECTGVDGIIIPKTGTAPVTADTIKTSAGAVFKVPIAKVIHIKDALFYLKSSGVTVVSASEKTVNSIFEVPLKGPCAIIMGSEDTGISPSILKMSDYVAKIPLLGSIGSLNVSVACGIFLYDALRQRQT